MILRLRSATTARPHFKPSAGAAPPRPPHTRTSSSTSSSSAAAPQRRATTGSGSGSSMSSSADDAAADAGKLKVLALHGFLQTGNVFRARVGSLRKGLKSRVAFEFVDAPFNAASTLTEEQVARFGGSQAGLTWFQWQDLGPDKRPSLAVEYAHWDVTYQQLCDALRQHQPDGLLGFSQGATATALFLAALTQAQRQGRDLDVPRPRFCVVCAGFLPNDPRYAQLLRDARVDVPALFIMGAADALIPPHRTQELLATFDPAAVETLEHPGAHFVPTCTGEFKQQLTGFLDRFKPAAAGAVGAVLTASASAGSSLEEPEADGGEGRGFPEAAAAAGAGAGGEGEAAAAAAAGAAAAAADALRRQKL